MWCVKIIIIVTIVTEVSTTLHSWHILITAVCSGDNERNTDEKIKRKVNMYSLFSSQNSCIPMNITFRRILFTKFSFYKKYANRGYNSVAEHLTQHAGSPRVNSCNQPPFPSHTLKIKQKKLKFFLTYMKNFFFLSQGLIL